MKKVCTHGPTRNVFYNDLVSWEVQLLMNISQLFFVVFYLLVVTPCLAKALIFLRPTLVDCQGDLSIV
jgi:hypothetical protein